VHSCFSSRVWQDSEDPPLRALEQDRDVSSASPFATLADFKNQ
jgi:hypothetical protein